MAGLFREKNLEKISNPDKLDDYIHVSNPGAWIVIAIILLLFAAGIIWGAFGTITETEPGILVMQNGQERCYLDATKAERLEAGDEISFQSETGLITSSAGAPQPLSEVSAQVEAPASEFQRILGNIDWVSAAHASMDLPDGVYEVKVVVERYAPFALIFDAERS